MEILSAIVGVVALIGSLVSAGVQMHNDKKTQDYNKELNQTVMEREDNSWQRAVADRSASGLSVAGLSQGAGSGGTVSQLQGTQGAGQLSQLLQGASSTAFGLANSAYDRKLQKQIATDELEVKKQELDVQRDKLRHEKLTSLIQTRLDTLRWTKEAELLDEQISSSRSQGIRDQAIYDHNISVAQRLGLPYGNNPDWTSVLLGKGSEILSKHLDDIKTALVNAPQAIVDSVSAKMESIKASANEKLKEKAKEVEDFINTSRAKLKEKSDGIKKSIRDFQYEYGSKSQGSTHLF